MPRAPPKRSSSNSRGSACRAMRWDCDRDQRRSGDRGAERARTAGRLRRHARATAKSSRAAGVGSPTDEDFTDLACTGLEEARPHAADYRADLERWAARDVHMHCLNPDRLVIRGGVPEACAGAIADLYQGLGGRVTWYGKPHPAIYATRSTSPAIRRRTRCWRSATGSRPTSSAPRAGLRRDLRQRRDQRRRAVSRGFRRAIWAWRLAPGGGCRRARLDSGHAACWTRDRARPALLPHRRAVRGRKRGASAKNGRAPQGDHRQARHPASSSSRASTRPTAPRTRAFAGRAWTRGCESSRRCATRSTCRS